MNVKEKIDAYVMNTYGRTPITFVKGRGARLWDDNGREYHDFLAGIAVCNLGHANQEIAEAVSRQARELVHVSNLYYTGPQARVAELLVNNSFAQRVFFCNSGAEANECAIKIARVWGKEKLNGAYTIIAMHNSFHGRTMATLSATGQERIQKGFAPLVPDFIHVPFGDIEAIKSAISPDVCAIMLEPIIGEGGVIVPPEGYLRQVRELCDEHNILMMLDEVQTGMGRTGKLFAYEHSGITPDVMSLAKALANGLPVGATLAGPRAADMLKPGMHASTFGAGPVVMAAALVVLDTMLEPAFMESVQSKGARLMAGLHRLIEKHPDMLNTMRGQGLIIGLEFKNEKSAEKVQQAMWQKGYIINRTQGNVLRFVPPLVVETSQIDRMLAELDHTLGGPMKTVRHLLSMNSLSKEEITFILRRAKQFKNEWSNGVRPKPLVDKAVGLLFEKPSTRTRVSFERGIYQLGGQPIFLTSTDSQMSRAEPPRDTARVMSGYVDGLVVRTFGQEILEEMAQYATVPVINALTDSHHPCQVLSDLLTVLQNFNTLDGLKYCWLGDASNVANSWIEAAARLNLDLTMACPKEFAPSGAMLQLAKEAGIKITNDPVEAISGAHVVNTDIWVSMGHEEERETRLKAFKGFRLDAQLLAKADPKAIVLHCLPAHRDEEISDDVIEGPQSLVWDQAENRLHVQKAVIEFLII